MSKKRVKKQLKVSNFYLTILTKLKSTTNLSKIRNELKISKQQLNYYLRELKKKGFIFNKDYGWWELTEKGKNPSKYDIFLNKDDVRDHANVWETEIEKIPENWNKRIEILEKKKINYKIVGAQKSTPRIKVLGRKVWLCNNHLRIFDVEKSSYYGKNAKEGRKLAKEMALRVIQSCEKKLGIKLNKNKIKFKKEHFALIKNDLAIEQNRQGVILRIKDEKNEEWLLVDDSLGKGGELETIGKKAYKRNPQVQDWWNDNKKHSFKVTPTFILTSMNGIQQNQQMFAQNMESHIGAVKQLGNSAEANALTVELLAEKVAELTDEIKKLKKQ